MVQRQCSRLEPRSRPTGVSSQRVETSDSSSKLTETDLFRIALAGDLAMHVAAASPRFVGRDDVDQAALEAERHIYREQALAEGKPEQIIDKIVEGKVGRYLSEVCLLEQPFVKDTDKKVGDMLTEAIATLGENIVVSRFARFAIGDSDATLATTTPTQN